MLLQNLLCHHKPKPGALIALGSKEVLEHMGLQVLVDSDPVVRHLYHSGAIAAFACSYFHDADADIGMDLERHPVFREIELGPDLVENSLSDIAERSVEVVKYEQFANHVFPLCVSSFVSSGHTDLPPKYVPLVKLEV